ncbi:MAG: small multi-drug export protein [Firmicutes bacterium]|nr:small multi-drug export protein [Bacillota bacterium]
MDYLKVFIMSTLPVVELRGGLPLGISLGLAVWEAFLCSYLGNIVIIPPFLWVLERLEKFIAKNRVTAPFYQIMLRKAVKKKELFARYGKYALFIFVAVPLPTTGAWTACVAARFFRIPSRQAFAIISLGVLAAGLIMLAMTWFVIGFSLG